MPKRSVTRLSGLEISLSATNPNTGLFLNSITTAQRDAIPSPTDGLLIFNGDTESYQGVIDGAYTNLSMQGGPSILKRTAVAGDYTILPTDAIIGVTDTSAVRNITLPLVATTTPGQIFIIADESAGTEVINILRNGALIDGAASNKTISSNYDFVRLYSTGTAWISIK